MSDEHTVEYWLEQLKSEFTETRVVAIQHLRELQDVRAIEPLINALDFGAPFDEFGETLAALLSFGDCVVPLLIDTLHSNDLSLSLSAITVLGSFKDERAIAPLLQVLDEDDEHASKILPSALAQFGVAVLDPLIERVQTHRNPHVQRTALSALSRITNPCVPAFAETQLSKRHLQQTAIHTLGRRETVTDMAEIAHRIDLIVPFLDDSRSSVRAIAAFSLGTLYDGRAFDPLVEHLAEADFELKLNIVLALGRIGSPKAIDKLVPLLHEEKLQEYVIKALG